MDLCCFRDRNNWIQLLQQRSVQSGRKILSSRGHHQVHWMWLIRSNLLRDALWCRHDVGPVSAALCRHQLRSLTTSLYWATKITLHLQCCLFNLHCTHGTVSLLRLIFRQHCSDFAIIFRHLDRGEKNDTYKHSDSTNLRQGCRILKNYSRSVESRMMCC